MNLKQHKYVEILLVEDNPADIRLIMEYFKEDHMINHRLNLVTNGVEAIKYLNKEDEYKDSPDPDIMLLDLYMPKMTGQEVLKKVRSDERFDSIIIGIMTSTESDAEKLNLDVSGCTFYIVKPVDVEKFLALMIQTESYLSSKS